MNSLRSAIDAILNADFSILGHIYLGPGRFLRLSAPEYLLVMIFGLLWLLGIGYVAWRVIGPAAKERRLDADRRLGVRVAVAFAILYAAWGGYVTLIYPPTTDEPHYLLIAQSLGHDGDIRLGGNYRRGDYRLFYPSDGIDPHALLLPDAEMYSQHTAGLPMALLPAYMLAGRWGILPLLAIFAGCLVGCLYFICRRAGVRRHPALICGVGAGATAPLALGATLVFSEVPAALLLSLGILTGGTGWASAVCAALLPWLHPRYAMLSIGLAAGLAWGSRDRGRILLKFAAAGAISAALFLSVYEGPALTAVLNVLTEKYPARLEDLGTESLLHSSAGNPLIGAAGKLFDRNFGAIPYSPWLLLLIPGIAASLTARGFPHAAILLTGGAYFIVSCLFRNWGGSTYPGRTLVPLLPLAVPYLGLGVQWALAGKGRKAGAIALLVASCAIALVLTACPVLRYTSGREWIDAKLGSASYLIPASWFPDFGDEGAALAAILLGIAALVTAILAGRRKTQ